MSLVRSFHSAVGQLLGIGQTVGKHVQAVAEVHIFDAGLFGLYIDGGKVPQRAHPALSQHVGSLLGVVLRGADDADEI